MLENPTSMASFVGSLMLDGFDIDAIENYDEMIKSISKDDIINVWKKIDSLNKKEVYGMIEI
jgi:predicted Zn-dependent peptidase